MDWGTLRRATEWTLLTLAVLAILGIAGYLGFRATRAKTPYVPIHARALLELVELEDGRYILPVRVANRSARTARELKVEVRSLPADGSEASRTLEVDYVGQDSTQILYVYFDRHPRELRVEVRPLSYLLD